MQTKFWHTLHQFSQKTTRCDLFSPLCLNTPHTPSCFLEVISDQMWHCVNNVCRRTHTWLCSHRKLWALALLICLSQKYGTQVSLKAVHVQPDQRLQQGVSDCGSISNVGSWPCTINGNATPNHGTLTLTYGRRSTTNFHHLLQFQWEWKGPGQKVMGEVIRSLKPAVTVKPWPKTILTVVLQCVGSFICALNNEPSCSFSPSLTEDVNVC